MRGLSILDFLGRRYLLPENNKNSVRKRDGTRLNRCINIIRIPVSVLTRENSGVQVVATLIFRGGWIMAICVGGQLLYKLLGIQGSIVPRRLIVQKSVIHASIHHFSNLSLSYKLVMQEPP